MPDDYPDYPSGAELLAYFNSYVNKFDLKQHIKFNTKVVKAIPLENKWKLFFEDSSEDFDYLIVANGHHWSPRIPTFEGEFSGELMHSHQFKNNEYFKDKSVLVVGGGNSACDIAVEVSRVAKKTSISMRRGYHFIPKFMMGIPSDAYYAKTLWIPQRIRLFFQKLALRIVQGSYENYGLQKPDHDILQSHATVNSELLYFIKHGKISPKKNCVIGFGITEKTISNFKNTDGLVVGSQICKEITRSLNNRQNPVTNVSRLVKNLKKKTT